MQLLVILVWCIRLIFAELLLPESEVPEKLLSYLLDVEFVNPQNNEIIGILISNTSKVAILESFLKTRWHEKVLLIDINKTLHPTSTRLRITNLMCFVSSKPEIEATTRFIRNHTFLHFDGRVWIVVAVVPDRNWVFDYLEYLWSENILDVVMAYEYGGSAFVKGYDPFGRTLLDLSLGETFVDKLSDLRGHPLRCSMYNDVPRNVLVEGKLHGKDVRLVQEISKVINANLTILILDDYVDVVNSVRSGTSDFSFLEIFEMSRNSISVNPTYPVMMEYLVLIVPTAELLPQYTYLFRVFRKKLWFYLVAVLLAATLLNMCISKLCGSSCTKAATTVYQVFLNTASNHFDRTDIWNRAFLTTWTVFSLLIVTAFTSELRSFLVTPRYHPEIRSIQDLLKSDLLVVVHAYWMASFFDNFKPMWHKVVNSTENNNHKMASCIKDHAYVGLSTQMLIFAKDCKGANSRPVYRVLEEHLGAGYNVYSFVVNSPYKRKFEKLLLSFRELGLGSFGAQFRERREIAVPQKPTMLTLDHLQSAFYVAAFGLTVSTIVFGVELACRRKTVVLEISRSYYYRKAFLVWRRLLQKYVTFNKPSSFNK